MKTAKYIEIEDRYGAHNYHPLDLVIKKAEGVWVEDVEGNKFMDFLAAYSAVNQGHCHPRLVKAFSEQMDCVTLTSRAFRNDQLGLFYKELCRMTRSHKVLPMNSGAEAVETASGDQQPLAVTHQVADKLAGLILVDNRADRHLDHEIITRLACPVATRPVGAALCEELAGMAKIHKRIHATVRFQQDTAAITAITAVGTAERYVLLAPETDTAIATVPGTHLDCHFVDEFHGCLINTIKDSPQRRRGNRERIKTKTHRKDAKLEIMNKEKPRHSRATYRMNKSRERAGCP